MDSGYIGSGDERPSHSSKPSVGESGRMMGSMMGSSQKATRFFLGRGGWLGLKVFSSMELREGAGEDILVEAVDPEALEPFAEWKLEKGEGTRDEGRLMSSSACLASVDAALRCSYACLRSVVRHGDEWWIARACISRAVAA